MRVVQALQLMLDMLTRDRAREQVQDMSVSMLPDLRPGNAIHDDMWAGLSAPPNRMHAGGVGKPRDSGCEVRF